MNQGYLGNIHLKSTNSRLVIAPPAIPEFLFANSLLLITITFILPRGLSRQEPTSRNPGDQKNDAAAESDFQAPGSASTVARA
ncbi:uncharacterized protein BDW43DRAFT_293342 [Aspergillus alliaceus]|uniref:uncharacterized protein n=1 Tax=Petromyces alliaceus TaxID=209559 RepID=UPI0012A6EE0A|nr:uncharacterized protein BDW43DRAFT_293342 [Aspergillus alliaceus]KAB8227760.1 hypothetical protein BDW43DRAFT_293342 [Aspergillus alliaceus]